MDIGNKIRELRTRKGLTLEELASRSELTKGFLSQLERDLTSPSIDSLSDILEALGTNLAEFFQEDKTTSSSSTPTISSSTSARTARSTGSFPTRRRIRWSRYCSSCPRAARASVEPHDGEEFGYVVEGSVVLVCDGEEHPLRRGETFYLHGRSFHLLKNVRKTTARVLWVSTPPLF